MCLCYFYLWPCWCCFTLEKEKTFQISFLDNSDDADGDGAVELNWSFCCKSQENISALLSSIWANICTFFSPDIKLRILPQQNTALLSSVCVCVSQARHLSFSPLCKCQKICSNVVLDLSKYMSVSFALYIQYLTSILPRWWWWWRWRRIKNKKECLSSVYWKLFTQSLSD